MPKAKNTNTVGLILSVEVAGVKVALETAAFLLPPAEALDKLDDRLLLNLVRQGTLKLIPTMGLRNRKELREALRRIATERQKAKERAEAEEAKQLAEAKRLAEAEDSGE